MYATRHMVVRLSGERTALCPANVEDFYFLYISGLDIRPSDTPYTI